MPEHKYGETIELGQLTFQVVDLPGLDCVSIEIDGGDHPLRTFVHDVDAIEQHISDLGNAVRRIRLSRRNA